LYPVSPAVAAGAFQVITITDFSASFQFPMKRPGASTAATASVVAGSVASGVASSVISGAADSVAAGAALSESDAGREITTIARSAIPITAAINTRGDVLCFGAALGFAGAAGLTGAGVVVTFTRVALFAPPSGTGGITILLAEVDFFAVFLTALFFFAGAFLATFFATAFFLAGAFFATFLAADFFFAGAFLATAFFAGAFLVTFFLATFLAAAFFLTATFELLQD
jgi:hypothetical protein